jgi:hypothetical protein
MACSLESHSHCRGTGLSIHYMLFAIIPFTSTVKVLGFILFCGVIVNIIFVNLLSAVLIGGHIMVVCHSFQDTECYYCECQNST